MPDNDDDGVKLALQAFYMHNVFPGQDYRHFKTGTIYRIKEISLNEPDLVPLVSYRDANDVTAIVWTRTLDVFGGYVTNNCTMVKRFERVFNLRP
jgi:hypothetical protein